MAHGAKPIFERLKRKLGVCAGIPPVSQEPLLLGLTRPAPTPLQVMIPMATKMDVERKATEEKKLPSFFATRTAGIVAKEGLEWKQRQRRVFPSPSATFVKSTGSMVGRRENEVAFD